MKTQNISLSASEKIGLIISLATMLTSGITLMEAVNSLLEDSKGNQRKLLQSIQDDITQGKRLYECLVKFPMIFDSVTINIIKASEESGTLDSTLKQIVINIKKDMEFMDKVKSALIYPIFIMIVFIVMLLMILIVVVPKLATVFKTLKIQLPLPTKILIFLSDMILKYTIPVLIFLTLFSLFIIFIYKTKKKLVTRIIFSLPIIKNLIIKIDLTRFTRSMSSLLRSGIIITTALDLTQEVVFNHDVNKMIVYCKQIVLSGKNLSEGLISNKKIIPTLMIKIIEAGEKSGTLDKSLGEVSEFLDYEVSGLLKTVTAMLEPIMLVGVGVMIGGMMLAIISPIYGLISQVGGS